VTCETSPQNVILGQIKNRDNMTMRKNTTYSIPYHTISYHAILHAIYPATS
jgi:hypothetical protein